MQLLLGLAMFIISILFLLFLIFYPGGFYLLYKKILNLPLAIALTPIINIFFLILFGIAMDILAIPINATAVYFLLILSSFFFLYLLKKLHIETHNANDAFFELALLLGYFISALFVYFIAFQGKINPSDFLQGVDNTFHLSTIRSMANSGIFSIFNVSSYLENNAMLFDAYPGGKFYPAGFHIYAAYITSILNIDVATASNAVSLVFSTVIYPLSFYSFIYTVFRQEKIALFLGAFLPLANTAFPLRFLFGAPLSSNLAAFCIVFYALALLHLAFSSKKESVRFFICMYFINLFIGYCLQPNSVFTMIVFSAPLLLHWIREQAIQRNLSKPSVNLLSIGFISLCITAWLLVNRSPLLHGAVSYPWPAIATLPEVTLQVLQGSYLGPKQTLFSLITIIGLFSVLFIKKLKCYSWLPIIYFLSLGIFIVNCTSSAEIQGLISGFWFNDQYRTAAVASLSSLPLILIGLVSITEFMLKYLSKINLTSESVKKICVLAISLLFCIGNYSLAPLFKSEEQTAFGFFRKATEDLYGFATIFPTLTEEEFNFCNSYLPMDSLIANCPYDGSVFIYPQLNANLLERKINYFGEGEKEELRLIRLYLKDIASNPDVREAVNALNVEYVLVMNPNDPCYLLTYDENDWQGILGITDETPGFTLVKRVDGNALYKIND